MALSLLFADGFDHYDDLTLNYSTVPGTNGILSASGHERTGLGCLQINTGGFGPTYTHGALTRLIATGAVNPGNGRPGAGQPGKLFLFGNFVFQILYFDDLSVGATYDNTGVTMCRSAANVISLNAYNYVAVRMLFSADPLLGQVDIWVNGALVASAVGQTTDVLPPVYTQLLIEGGNNTGWWDDFSLWTWGNNNDVFPYVPNIYVAMPSADSAPLAWTPSTGATHFNLVNEIPQSTAELVSSATVGQIDQYTHAIPVNQQVPAVPAATNVLGCLHALLARVDSGARTIASDKAGAVGADLVLNTSYLYRNTPYTPGLSALADLPTTPLGPKVVA